MVVFSFQSIINIQCTVVLASSIYSAECTNIGLFSLPLSAVSSGNKLQPGSSQFVIAVYSQVVLLFFDRCQRCYIFDESHITSLKSTITQI